MVKIFRYECKRLLWNKFFFGILAVTLFYGWQVLTGASILGVSHTAPFSPWTCKGIQAAAPVDSYVDPEPWDMPGYDSQVIMAAGAFVQGSSIELSADGPVKEPYAVYFQGGLTWEHAKLGVMMSLQKLVEQDLVKLQ